MNCEDRTITLGRKVGSLRVEWTAVEIWVGGFTTSLISTVDKYLVVDVECISITRTRSFTELGLIGDRGLVSLTCTCDQSLVHGEIHRFVGPEKHSEAVVVEAVPAKISIATGSPGGVHSPKGGSLRKVPILNRRGQGGGGTSFDDVRSLRECGDGGGDGLCIWVDCRWRRRCSDQETRASAAEKRSGCEGGKVQVQVEIDRGFSFLIDGGGSDRYSGCCCCWLTIESVSCGHITACNGSDLSYVIVVVPVIVDRI